MRIQVSLSDDFVKRLDQSSKSIGMSRSAFCAFLIGQGLSSYEQAQKVTRSMADDHELLTHLAKALVDGREVGGAGLDPAPTDTASKAKRPRKKIAPV